MTLKQLNVGEIRKTRKKFRTLGLEDFFLTSYGQTRKEVLEDYDHYVKTGEVIKPLTDGLSV